eukprot:gene1918-1982_t
MQECLFIEAVSVIHSTVTIAAATHTMPPWHFLHTKMTKEARAVALKAFRDGEDRDGYPQRILITTDDFARFARKIEIPHINLVINYSFPKNKEAYLHRMSGVGRMAQKLATGHLNDDFRYGQSGKTLEPNHSSGAAAASSSSSSPSSLDPPPLLREIKEAMDRTGYNLDQLVTAKMGDQITAMRETLSYDDGSYNECDE